MGPVALEDPSGAGVEPAREPFEGSERLQAARARNRLFIAQVRENLLHTRRSLGRIRVAVQRIRFRHELRCHLYAQQVDLAHELPLLAAPLPGRFEEARDPQTDGERLRALCLREGPAEVMFAALQNPSFPLDELRTVLLDTSVPAGPDQVAAWHNPAVSVLLLSDPRPEYREAARGLLAWANAMDGRAESLESLVARVASGGSRQPVTSRTQRGRDLARRLAGLFGLPWPATS